MAAHSPVFLLTWRILWCWARDPRVARSQWDWATFTNTCNKLFFCEIGRAPLKSCLFLSCGWRSLHLLISPVNSSELTSSWLHGDNNTPVLLAGSEDSFPILLSILSRLGSTVQEGQCELALLKTQKTWTELSIGLCYEKHQDGFRWKYSRRMRTVLLGTVWLMALGHQPSPSPRTMVCESVGRHCLNSQAPCEVLWWGSRTPQGPLTFSWSPGGSALQRKWCRAPSITLDSVVHPRSRESTQYTRQ